MPDVLLVYPPMKKVGIADHLGLPYIAAYLREKGMSVQIVDTKLEGWSPRRAVEEISKIPAKVIGVTLPFQIYAVEVLNFISALRKKPMRTYLWVAFSPPLLIVRYWKSTTASILWFSVKERSLSTNW